MFIEMGFNPTDFEEYIANVVEQENWNIDSFGMFLRIKEVLEVLCDEFLVQGLICLIGGIMTL